MERIKKGMLVVTPITGNDSSARNMRPIDDCRSGPHATSLASMES